MVAEETLTRKRKEYVRFLTEYLSDENTLDDNEKKMMRTISVDVPRTQPDYQLFKHVKLQEMLRRLLFIWNIRHPACG
jgi:hypothetical protein